MVSDCKNPGEITRMMINKLIKSYHANNNGKSTP